MSSQTKHLCVLVHGLWGNPDHLKYLSTSLRNRFSDDQFHILVAKRNAGSYTYDGVDTGGERVANEVEQKLQELAQDGHDIEKISFVGYSLGGLICRYAIGLLYSKGVFEKIVPVNFTTFATPHIGVRSPRVGYPSHVWNVLAARTLSMSGRQLFGIDSFRDTGRSLLSILADPESIFLRALGQFQERSLYANIQNDRTVSYYTAAISQSDPYINLDDIDINYVPGYDRVIIDGENPVAHKAPTELPAFAQRLGSKTRAILETIPFAVLLAIFIPVGSTLYLCTSLVQSFQSRKRIRSHDEGRAGHDYGRYKIPLVIDALRKEAENIFESANNAQGQNFLAADADELPSPTQPTSLGEQSSQTDASSVEKNAGISPIQFPTLALTQEQFKMVEALDNLGFKKHPVCIHNHRHSHAAIIVRIDKKSFDEGRVVVKHWLDHFVL